MDIRVKHSDIQHNNKTNRKHHLRYADGHIANTTNIDVLQEGFIEKVKAHISSLPTNGESEGILIAVNCRSGKRSKKAATLLVNHGYKVIELDAGYNDWLSKGMPVTKG